MKGKSLADAIFMIKHLQGRRREIYNIYTVFIVLEKSTTEFRGITVLVHERQCVPEKYIVMLPSVACTILVRFAAGTSKSFAAKDPLSRLLS